MGLSTRQGVQGLTPIIGYHGCTAVTATRILTGESFSPSSNDYDWPEQMCGRDGERAGHCRSPSHQCIAYRVTHVFVTNGP